MGKSAGGLSPQTQKSLGGLGQLSMMSGAARHDPNVAASLRPGGSQNADWSRLTGARPQAYEPWSLNTGNPPMRISEGANQMFNQTIGGLGQAPQNLQFQPGMTPNPQLGASPPGKGGGVGGRR